MTLLSDREETLMIGEELFRRPDLGPCELVNGRIVPTPPAGDDHADVELELGMRLRLYGKESKRGRALGGGVGIYIRRNPDTIRAADIVFLSKERDVRPRAQAYLEAAPDLVVEVISADELWSDVTEKVGDYFTAGVDRVWLVSPTMRRIFVYRSPTRSRQIREGEDLADEELLPGFRVSVRDLFG